MSVLEIVFPKSPCYKRGQAGQTELASTLNVLPWKYPEGEEAARIFKSPSTFLEFQEWKDSWRSSNPCRVFFPLVTGIGGSPVLLVSCCCCNINTNLLAQNNNKMLLYSSEDKKSKMSFMGLKSRCWQCWFIQLQGEICFLAFSASRAIVLAFFGHNFFLHHQSQWHSIFKTLFSLVLRCPLSYKNLCDYIRPTQDHLCISRYPI